MRTFFKLFRSWLNDARRRWLIVLDNADDAEFLFEAPQTSDDAGARPRIECLPFCPHGSVLVTSRRRAVAQRLTDSRNIINIQPNKEHAIALLESKLEQKDEVTNVGRLVAALEYMPLAIAQAAAYINKKTPRCTIEDYLSKLEKGDKSKSSLLKVQFDELRRDRSEAKNSILLTWQISFEHIHSTRRSAVDLLSLMSLFDHQGIPESLLKANISEVQPQPDKDEDDDDNAMEEAFEDDIDILRDYAFVSVTLNGSAFEMHRLVQLAAQLWLKSKGQYQLWEGQSFQKLDAVFPIARYEQWRECRALYPHARLMLASRIKERDAQLFLASVMNKAASFALTQGSYVEAEVMAKRSMELRKGILGDQHTDTLTSMASLALTYNDQGRSREAEKLEVEVMETRRTVLGVEHPSTLTSIANLALTYSNQGRWKEAEELQVKVMETTKTVLGVEHPDTLTSIANLASTYSNQGRWKEAEELQVKEMETTKTVLGVEHPDTLRSMGNLASTYSNQGRSKEAEELELKALETMRAVLDVEHPSTLTIMANLASTYWEQGR